VKNVPIQNASQEIVPGDAENQEPENQEIDLLAPYWKQVREKLFPLLQEETGLKLTDKLKTLAQILEIVRIEQLLPAPKRGKRGGQEIDRRPLARAFLAKAFFNMSQTRALKELLDQSGALRKLCGMEWAPSEPTFSRAFSQFAQMGLGPLVHAALVKKFVSPQHVMHVSHDSTALEAREKAIKKQKVPKVKKSGGDPRKENIALPQSQLGSRGK
jgi:transposase